MNENTTKLLQQLAEKLGTTSEYLWSVLVSQAPLSATITLIKIALVIFAGVLLYRQHRKFTSEVSDKWGETGKGNGYDKHDYRGPMMIILGISWGLFVILCFAGISNVITGFFNPEYWALKEILDAIS